ncbi:hypothetical protein COT40_01470 [Candidatus Peregrinibacteria bacterium CG08_land_8_20_14_0_20_41_10]|nr:MAG: hypothetical protein COT40_01470 [Candidatus Peregrinibacteria bacterium CG08_land_8_20_14_0_20_41_10]
MPFALLLLLVVVNLVIIIIGIAGIVIFYQKHSLFHFPKQYDVDLGRHLTPTHLIFFSLIYILVVCATTTALLIYVW